MIKNIYCCDHCEKEFDDQEKYEQHVENCLENPDNVMDIWKYKFHYYFNTKERKFEEIFLGKTPYEKIDSGKIFIKKHADLPDGETRQKEYYTEFVCTAMLGAVVVDCFSVSTIIKLAIYSDKQLDKNVAEKMFLKKISQKIANDIHSLELKKYEIDLEIEALEQNK